MHELDTYRKTPSKHTDHASTLDCTVSDLVSEDCFIITNTAANQHRVSHPAWTIHIWLA